MAIARSGRLLLSDDRGGTISEVCIAIPLFLMLTLAVITFSLVATQQAILNDSLRIAGRKSGIVAPARLTDASLPTDCSRTVNMLLDRQLRRYPDMPAASATTRVDVRNGVRGLSIHVAARLFCPFCSIWGTTDRYSESMYFPLEDQTACL